VGMLTHVFIGCLHGCYEPGVHAGQSSHRNGRQSTDTKLDHSEGGEDNGKGEVKVQTCFSSINNLNVYVD